MKIVKALMPAKSKNESRSALVYNKNRSLIFMQFIDKIFLNKMGKKREKFFYYTMEDNQPVILDEAPQQDW